MRRGLRASRAGESAAGRAGVRRGPSPSAAAFWGLLTVGVGLRVWTILAYPPAVLSPAVHDAAAYIYAAHHGLAQAPLEPSGYPLFVRILHAFSHALVFTIVIQHALGIVTGLLLFLIVRRLGGSAWLALVPAAIVWLNGDQLFLEHAVMSETVFSFMVTAMLYAGIRSLDGGWAWPLLTGVLAVGLFAVRSVSLLMTLIVVVWLAAALLRSLVPWRGPVVAILGGVLLAGGAYIGVRLDAGSSILPNGGGWNLYARVAPFADCAHFHPPAGTAMLCQRTPPASRLGPSYYLWLGGPARAAFGGPPNHDALLNSFAFAAIRNQPLDYLHAVGVGLVDYIAPTLGRNWPNDVAGVQPLNFLQPGPMVDPAIRRQVLSYYGSFSSPNSQAAGRLLDYQRVFRVTGTMLLVLLALTALALLPGPAKRRPAVILLIVVALYLLVMPVAVLHTEWRYAIPAFGPLAALAAVGAGAGGTGVVGRWVRIRGVEGRWGWGV